MAQKDMKMVGDYNIPAELAAKIDAICREETTAKLDDIQAYIDSGELDADIAKAHAK